LGLAIWDSSSSSFTYTSSGMFSKILATMLLPELEEMCKNEPPEAILRRFEVFLLRPI
jgi:hypothetical protein